MNTNNPAPTSFFDRIEDASNGIKWQTGEKVDSNEDDKDVEAWLAAIRKRNER